MRNLSSLLEFILSSKACVCVDSRKVNPGDIFFALKGAKVDGHDYLNEVFEKGAVAAVISTEYSGALKGVSIAVEDSLGALQTVAQEKMKLYKGKVVAVTGSVGKTTTKNFITELLSAKLRISSSPGNNNSQIGLPLSILNNLDLNSDAAIFEMGMSFPGDIAKLVSIAPPDIAVLLSVELVHAMNFNSIEEIAKAKSEIFSSEKKPFAIFNSTLKCYESVISNLPKHSLTFGGNGTSPFSANYVCFFENEKLVIVENGLKSIQIPHLQLLGEHNLQNLLASIAVARKLALSWEVIIDKVGELKNPEKRMELKEKRAVTFVDDSYSASFVAVKAALDSLPSPNENGKKIAVLGPMAELGAFSFQCHQDIGYYALDKVDSMICLGTECLAIEKVWLDAKRQVYYAKDHQDIANHLRHIAKDGDVVLLKGSNLYRIGEIYEIY